MAYQAACWVELCAVRRRSPCLGPNHRRGRSRRFSARGVRQARDFTLAPSIVASYCPQPVNRVLARGAETAGACGS